MKIVGIGGAGCRLADTFGEYPQYTVYKIDDEVEKEKRTYCISKASSVEEYEEKCPSFKNFFRSFRKGDEVMCIVSGASKVSAVTLRALSAIQRTNITLLYIMPEMKLIAHKQKLHERVAFNVFQEYARSGLFERMYIVNNAEVEKIIDNVPVVGYHSVLNHTIAATMHMINVWDNNDPVYSSSSETLVTTRVSSFGIVDMKNNQEKLFFPIDNVNEKCYIYAINKNRLETDGKLFAKLKEKIHNGSEMISNVKIYSTDYDEDYAYVIASSSEIQTRE